MKNFMNGFIKENPVLVLYLGICSALAVSASLDTAIGMGLSVIVVLTLSNIIISALRTYIPDEIRIPVYITIIASLVTIVEMLLKAYAEALSLSLGIFIPLIVVNCIILGRAESFASKNPVIPSAIDGISMGMGYTFSLVIIALFRQFLATGGLSMSNPFNPSQIFFNFTLIPEDYTIGLFSQNAGAFIAFAIFAALFAYLKDVIEKKEKMKKKEASK